MSDGPPSNLTFRASICCSWKAAGALTLPSEVPGTKEISSQWAWASFQSSRAHLHSHEGLWCSHTVPYRAQEQAQVATHLCFIGQHASLDLGNQQPISPLGRFQWLRSSQGHQVVTVTKLLLCMCPICMRPALSFHL